MEKNEIEISIIPSFVFIIMARRATNKGTRQRANWHRKRHRRSAEGCIAKRIASQNAG